MHAWTRSARQGDLSSAKLASNGRLPTHLTNKTCGGTHTACVSIPSRSGCALPAAQPRCKMTSQPVNGYTRSSTEAADSKGNARNA